jgi:hypothetical protein
MVKTAAPVAGEALQKGVNMARLLILAAFAPLLLIGAAYPGEKPGSMHYASDDRAEAPVTYRPCRPGPGDDRCIQLYERGVRTAYARWLRDHGVTGRSTQVAMGGPEEPAPRPQGRSRYGRHEGHAERHTERCRDDREYGDEARGM